MDPQRVLDLCREHAAAEAIEDVERVLATLCPDPRFEFFPMRRCITGWDNVETFYRTQYGKFATSVVGYDVIGEWTNEVAALQEYVIDVRNGPEGGDAQTTRYHVVSMMPADDESGLLKGERLYCDDGFVHALLGPLTAHLEPID